MIRPMTSGVSALSGVVANAYQAIPFVSSAPSKIPYGGFSPVRPQTRLTPRPPSQACRRLLIGRPCRDLRPRRLPMATSAPLSVPQRLMDYSGSRNEAAGFASCDGLECG